MDPSIKGLNRTSKTRYNVYTGDGSGRDSYVIVGNGGVLKPECYLNNAPHVGYHPPRASNSMYMGPVKKFSGAGKDATAFRYWGDGSGRDYYAVKDSGGLIPPYASKSPQANFYASLRQYEQTTVGGNGSINNKFTSVDANGRAVKDRV
jgi:hypothetical protein